jgi:sugar/nucleoside kinase (ribokinase family)
MGSHVVAIGDLVADILCVVPSLPVEPGAIHTPYPIRLEPGGSGNFLITAARLGLKASALGALGTDAVGDIIYAALSEEGVDLQFVYRPPHSTTTTVLVLVGEDGAHALIGSYGRIPPLCWHPEWGSLFRESSAVFMPGYTLAEPAFQEVALAILERSRERDCRIVFDAGPMAVHIPKDALKAALALAEVVLLTEEEAHALQLDPSQILQEGPRIVVLKRGAAGCRIFTATQQVEAPGFPVSAVDPVGAGDSFAAGWVYAMLKGWPLERAALFANAVGAAKVQKRGTGRQMPTRAEVRQVLERHRPDLLRGTEL